MHSSTAGLQVWAETDRSSPRGVGQKCEGADLKKGKEERIYGVLTSTGIPHMFTDSVPAFGSASITRT